jgi:O-antigen ligase
MERPKNDDLRTSPKHFPPHSRATELSEPGVGSANMAYLGLLCYLILLYIRPQDWVPAVLNLPLELVVAGGTTIAAVFGYSRRRHGPPPVHLYLLPLWVLIILLSNVINGNTSDGITQAIKYLKLSVVFVMIWLAVDTPRKLQGVLFLIVTMAALLGWQGIYMKQHGIGWAGQPLYWAERIRWVGLWDGANVLSLLFVTAVAFVLEMVFGKSNVAIRLYGALAGTLILTGLFLANSRGGYLALGVMIMLYFRTRVGKKGLVVGGMLVALLVALGPSRLRGNAEEDADDTSKRHRIDMWYQGFQMVKESPVLGIGKGQFAEYTHMLIAHNTIVQNMGETGILGLFVFISLVYAALKALLSVPEDDAYLGPLVGGLRRSMLACFVGYLSASMFITTDFDLLYVFMALIVAVVNIARRQTGYPFRVTLVRRDFQYIGAATAAAMMMMYVAVRVLG